MKGSMNSALKRLEIRHLRLVKALSQANGMSSAAKQLHLTQSALSHQLKVLEEALGYELFLRHGKKLIPTAHGRRVMETAETVLSDLALMQEDLADIDSGKNVKLRVATECITTFQWLPRAIPLFKLDYPDVEIELVPKACSNITELLDSGDIDIGIKMHPVKSPFKNHGIFKDKLVVTMSDNHPLASSKRISPEQVAKENVLLCPNAKEKLFKGLSFHVDINNIKTTEFPLTEAIIEWCSAGLGVSVLADWAAKAWPEKGIVLRALNAPWSRRQWTAITLPNPMPDYQKHFIKCLKQVGPELS